MYFMANNNNNDYKTHSENIQKFNLNNSMENMLSHNSFQLANLLCRITHSGQRGLDSGTNCNNNLGN